MYDFSNKRALVTGGSRGIGKEVVKQLTNCGAQVFALSKSQGNLDALKAEIPSVETICVDISDWKKTEEALSKIGTIDLLVNNAGIGDSCRTGEITEERYDELVATNLKSVINVSQIITKRLKDEKKPGSIVNVSSVTSLLYMFNISYASVKAALDKITKTMAVDLGPYQIRVNSVNPTFVNTDMTKVIFEIPELGAELKAMIPLDEFCKTEDVANAVLFLLSDKARMINGVILPIDGGQAAK
ncbi:L-xylulose reductase-like [Centruroides sculpturatus]|uniref:L-xylulose reductase-like n=1 Tax=Centruroides sculpturatus TaxID=218467 RepID=UPI000C6CD774|nr:L-xylulose reductase-like [Centruroides sculpturatus]